MKVWVLKFLFLRYQNKTGGSQVGECATTEPPVAVFPAHWAPNDLKIYKATQFPEGYRGGAFIAFHGSWNRAPGPQGGYNVVFQPLAEGKPSGDYIVFADGFAGRYKEPGRAAHRPSGLAVGPDGALYVSDDKAGRIWRITYVGDPNTKGIEAAPAPATEAKASTGALPPEGIDPDAGEPAKLSPPPLVNIVRIICADWLVWLRHRRGCKNVRLTTTKVSNREYREGWSASVPTIVVKPPHRGRDAFPPGRPSSR